jgi:hypothetical protein
MLPEYVLYDLLLCLEVIDDETTPVVSARTWNQVQGC